jgi:hypothetical protein
MPRDLLVVALDLCRLGDPCKPACGHCYRMAEGLSSGGTIIATKDPEAGEI